MKNPNVAVLSAVAALMLTACGGGGSDSPGVQVNPTPAPSGSPSPSPAPSPGAAQPTPAPTPVVVQLPPAPVAGTPIPSQPIVETKPVVQTPAPVAAPTPTGVPAGATLPLRNNDQGVFYLTTDQKLYKWNGTSEKWDVATQQPPAPAPAPTPAAPPQPAEGTYILGKLVKAAMDSNKLVLPGCERANPYQPYQYQPPCDTTAYPVIDGKVDETKPGVMVNTWKGVHQYQQYSYPMGYTYQVPNPDHIPHASVMFEIDYTDGVSTLGKTISTYSGSIEKALSRPEGDFVIKDDDKFILNTSAATWYGVEGEKDWFVQLQISTFPSSDTVFKLCLHQYFPSSVTGTVRRLSCTLHDKVTGSFRGNQMYDDSRGLGATEYVPKGTVIPK